MKTFARIVCNRHYRPIFPSHVQRTLLIVQKLLFSLESNDCLYTLTRSKQQKATKYEQKGKKTANISKTIKKPLEIVFQFSMNFCTATRLVRNNTKQLLITLTYTAVAVVVAAAAAASRPVTSDFPVNISMIMIDCASTFVSFLLLFYTPFVRHSSSRPYIWLGLLCVIQ